MDQKTRDELLKLFQSKLNQAMTLYLETCSRCGVCTKACHVHESMPQVKYIAAYRAEIVRRIYKKYFKGQGKLWSTAGESKELTDMALEELYEAAYSCTGCRRCVVFCPFGIDTQMIMSIAKLLLVGAHAEPEILTMLADTSITKGDSLEIFKEGFLQGVKNLEAEVVKKWQSEAGKSAIPIDVEGADLLYVALAGAHSIIPAAAIFNAAGENWTLSFFEAVNFGAFVGDPTRSKLILKRIIDEATRLKVKEVCICECGTAFRVMKQQSGKQPFKVTSITEVHARYLKEGRIRLDKSKLKEPVTYHDPCQMARNGGIIDEPRYVLSHLTDNFREMTDDPRYNWCCGGGGGLVALGEDTLDFRMKSSKVKVDQVKKTGASILTTA
ncbi:MAG: (Fe-S)-binding protein, partial [Desulfobacteraceae bacterium]|nr:(Fe-S)-binding protein [Desulfobacteraceae bacterium]